MKDNLELFKKSLYHFSQIFLENFFTLPPAKFHINIIEKISDEKIKRYAVACPRSFGKTTICSIALPLWYAYTRPKSQIILISATDRLSINWLVHLKREIQNNELLCKVYGEQRGQIWQDDWIFLKNGSSIRALGRECQVRGYRPNLIVADDLEDDKVVQNSDSRQRLKDWFFMSLVNTLEADCKIIVVGTILHRFSLLNELIKDPYTNKAHSGWIGDIYDCYDENNNSMWKEKWSNDELKRRKEEIGIKAFYTEYRNKPIEDTEALFKSEWIQLYKRSELRGDEDFFKVASLDPAFTTKDISNYSGLVLLGIDRKDPENRIRVLKAYNEKLSLSQLVDKIFDINDDEKPMFFAVEFHSIQKILKTYLIQEGNRRKKHIPIYPCYSDRDKRRRALSITSVLEQKKVFFDITDIPQKELIEQLLTYPPKYDDLLDAFVYGIRTILETYFSPDRSKVKYLGEIDKVLVKNEAEEFYDEHLGEFF